MKGTVHFGGGPIQFLIPLFMLTSFMKEHETERKQVVVGRVNIITGVIHSVSRRFIYVRWAFGSRKFLFNVL